MTKEMRIRIEFKDKSETIKFDALFQAKYLGAYDPNRGIADFAIAPIKSAKHFTDEEVEAFLAECDEKVKSYEILQIKEI